MYLGIDLGTSSMKCLILGEEQEILLSVISEEIYHCPRLKMAGQNKIHHFG